jgi:hypothetical protein
VPVRTNDFSIWDRGNMLTSRVGRGCSAIPFAH